MTYKEKLLDPRWQKKRLDILQRDEFSCQICKDKTTTLHVHHFSYEKSGNPWDTPDDDLITYCECCHCLATRLGTKSPEDFIIYAKKRKLTDGASILMCLVGDDDGKRFISLYEYKNREITLDTVLTFEMVEDINSIVDLYKKFISNG